MPFISPKTLLSIPYRILGSFAHLQLRTVIDFSSISSCANMKTTAACTVVLLLSIADLQGAEATFWDSPDAYIGQPRPSETPRPFAPLLLADKGTFTMDRIAFSNDGMEIYYVQNDQFFNLTHAKIKTFKYVDGKWSAAKVLNEHFYAPTFSVNDDALFFMGPNPTKVWQSQRTADGWSIPAIFLEKPYGLYDFMPTTSGRCYVGSDAGKGNVRDWNTYKFCVVEGSGATATIRSLGVPLNEPGFNGDFFVAKDESFMIVSAKETPDFECELFISFRRPNDTWSKPQSLGPLINDGVAHRWGEYVTPDNKFLFYSRATSEKDCAIYWVRFDRLLENARRSSSEPRVQVP
jgi:hypothetical protein